MFFFSKKTHDDVGIYIYIHTSDTFRHAANLVFFLGCWIFPSWKDRVNGSLCQNASLPVTRWKAGKTSGIDRAQLDTVRLSQFPSWARWILKSGPLPGCYWEMKVLNGFPTKHGI